MKQSGKVFGVLLALLPPTTPAPATAVEPTFGGTVGAVVRVDATIMPGAQTTRSLGKERSGVVIGDDGLILTIGYLIMELATLTRVYAAVSQGRVTGGRRCRRGRGHSAVWRAKPGDQEGRDLFAGPLRLAQNQ